MAKEFAKKFYRSKAWKQCREAYVKSVYGLCERCGKPGQELHHKIFLNPLNINDSNITLNWDNLIFLCKDCHFAEHRKTNPLINNFKKKNKIINNGAYLENGELKKQMVYIVYGSPGAGKTTYVLKNKKEGDLIVDLDYIKQSISLEKKTETPDNLLPIAIGIREYIYKLIEDKKVNSKNIWVVSSLPNKIERETLANRLEAELIFINKDINECIENIDGDGERKNKSFQHSLVYRWFENFQP